MANKYVNPPNTDDWKSIAQTFEEEWNFPGCLGALDGEHVCIECPGGGGSAYYNYKGFHSIVLMALYDDRYCFNLVDIGAYGRDNDTSIFNNSIFGVHFHSGNIILPNDIRSRLFNTSHNSWRLNFSLKGLANEAVSWKKSNGGRKDF